MCLNRHTAFDQSASPLRSTCPSHLIHFVHFLISKLSSSNPNNSLISAFPFFSFNLKPRIHLSIPNQFRLTLSHASSLPKSYCHVSDRSASNTNTNTFPFNFQRRARYCLTFLYVRPSVCPSRCGIVSKRMNAYIRMHISSNLLTVW